MGGAESIILPDRPHWAADFRYGKGPGEMDDSDRKILLGIQEDASLSLASRGSVLLTPMRYGKSGRPPRVKQEAENRPSLTASGCWARGGACSGLSVGGDDAVDGRDDREGSHSRRLIGPAHLPLPRSAAAPALAVHRISDPSSSSRCSTPSGSLSSLRHTPSSSLSAMRARSRLSTTPHLPANKRGGAPAPITVATKLGMRGNS